MCLKDSVMVIKHHLLLSHKASCPPVSERTWTSARFPGDPFRNVSHTPAAWGGSHWFTYHQQKCGLFTICVWFHDPDAKSGGWKKNSHRWNRAVYKCLIVTLELRTLVFEQNFGPGLFSGDLVAGSEKRRRYMERESSCSVKRVTGQNVISTAGHTAFKHPVHFNTSSSQCTATSWSNVMSVGYFCWIAKCILM